MTEAIHIKRRAEVAARLLTGKMPKNFIFHMASYLHKRFDGTKVSCDTAGCIAGLTKMMYDGYSNPVWDREVARRVLGLSPYETDLLFEPANVRNSGIRSHEEINEVEAGRVLARFVLTDKIDWSVRDTPIKVGERIF